MEIRELRTNAEIGAALSSHGEPSGSRPGDHVSLRNPAPSARGLWPDRWLRRRSARGSRGDPHTHTLARGEHLFIDDRVTAEEARGRGRGRELVGWLAAHAGEGIARIHLDSRLTAKGFYEALGSSSRPPCPAGSKWRRGWRTPLGQAPSRASDAECRALQRISPARALAWLSRS